MSVPTPPQPDEAPENRAPRLHDHPNDHPNDHPGDHLDDRLAWFDRASELTGPMGTAAGATVFALVARDEVVTWRLWWWLGLMAVALAAMVAGWVTDRRRMLALPGHALSGLGWGVVLLLGTEDLAVTSGFLWLGLAFQFATTAVVMSGRTIDDLLGRSVVVSMWLPAAVVLVVVGHPLLGVAAVVFLALVFRDLTNSSVLLHELVELRKSESERAERAAESALIDPLTGLLNRSGLERELARATDVGAAMFIDLDRFKDVNDRHGHHVGDQVLVEVADRLRRIFRSDDLVARLGGDEFLVVLAGEHDTVLLADRAAQVIGSLEPPVDVDGEYVLCSASVGVAEIPPGPIDAERVMSESDHAMYRAKRSGRRRAVLFGDDLRRELAERSELSAALRRAVRDRSIQVWGQPVVEVDPWRLAGVELLSRWQLPDGRWVSPDRFIPVAEEIGVSGELALNVLTRAEQLFEAWSDDPVFRDVVIGVNASVFDLGDRSFVESALDLVRRLEIDPARLAVEVTESISLAPDEDARFHLDELARAGIRIILDDFGTGYSSISGLLGLPLDSVKIDRSLIATLGSDPRMTDVVRSIADLARTLGRSAVAEGVETVEQLALVEQLGFRFVQGYHLCRPMPLDDLAGAAGRAQLARSGLLPGESPRTPACQ